MAFPQVAAVNGGYRTSNWTDHTVNLPADISEGDLLLVFFASDGAPDITFPVGWTQLFQTLGDLDAIKFGAWYRIATGEEGATINVTTSNTQMTAHTSYRITGYSGVPEAGTAVVETWLYPNPPSLTPTWGAADTLWFACCGYDGGDNTITVYPADYTDSRNDRYDNSASCGVGTARRELNPGGAGAENPGAFTISAQEQYIANTIAIQPVVAGVTGGTGSLSQAALLLLG